MTPRAPNRQLGSWLEASGLTRPQLVVLIAKISGRNGQSVEVSRRSIQRWVCNGVVPHPPMQILVAAALGEQMGVPVIPGDLGWVDHTTPASDTDQDGYDHPAPSGAAEHAQEGEVLRRQMLRLLAAGGAGLTPSSRSALTQVRSLMDTVLESGAARPSGIGGLEAQAALYADGYRGQAPAAVLGNVLGDVLAAHAALDRPLTSANRQRLCAVAARLAGTAGIILHDLGETGEAAGWFETASSAAREIQDGPLEGWILGRHAMVEINFGSPRLALTLSSRARAVAGPAATSPAALAAAVQARSYALLRRPEQAARALGQAEDLLGGLRDEDAADTWFGYPEAKHQVHASHALTAAGLTRQAAAAQDRARELSRGTSWMTRALLGLDQAACVIRDGDADAGARQAVTVLRALPAAYRSGLVVARARDVHHTVPAGARALASARELSELVT